jgi:hypothetical protein
MTSLDDLILQESIRCRVGDPGEIVRVERTGASPLTEFRALAEQISGHDVELVSVANGIPGHFSLRGRDRRTVVFHLRQVEICAFLYGLTLERRIQGTLLEDVFEGAVLRLIAEFLTQRGHGDQAISALARSRMGQSVTLYGPTLEQLEGMDRDERFLVEWFFALGHEIGHGLVPELAADLNNLAQFEPDFIRETVDVILDARFSAEDADHLRDIIQRGDAGMAPLSHASSQALREEAVADLFALICMSEAWGTLCADQAGRAYYPEQLLLESIVSMSSVMMIEQCRILAGWFSDMSSEIENQPLLLSGVALQARINLLQLALRDPQVQSFLTTRYPSLGAFARLDTAAFEAAMRQLELRSLRLGEPFDRARAFLSSPELRDAGRVQDYFEAVAADRTMAFDAMNFLRVTQHLRSPILDALRDVVDGGEPPIVYPADRDATEDLPRREA